jgi:hypothetical protein
MNTKKYFFFTFVIGIIAISMSNITREFKNDSPEKNQPEIQRLKKELGLVLSRLDEIEKIQKKTVDETELKISKTIDMIKELVPSEINETDNIESGDIESDNDNHTVESISANLDNRIYSGENDEQWTTSLTSKINRLFDLELDNNVSLLDIRCETELCKIEVEHNDADSKVLLLSNLARIEAFNNQDTFYKTVANEDGTEITSLYVARAGFDLSEISEE